ncbi:MAG: SIMPL domain-containing protein [Opitutaceae bacterium]
MKNTQRSPFPISLAAACLAVSALTPSLSAETDPDDRRILTVSAQSSVEIPTTHVRITVMIEAREDTPQAAQAAIARRSNPVLEFLKDEAVEKLQTSGLSLNPIFERNPKRPDSWSSQTRIVGYNAQWTTSFEVSVEKAGAIADEVVKKGADRIAGFELKAKDEAVEEARTEALRLASMQARDRGIAVLDALGYEMIDVVRVHVQDNGPIYPMRAMRAEMMTMAADAAPPTAVEGGMQSIPGSVTLEIAY